MSASGDASRMALVCGSERILIDKVTLFTNLELFRKNPGLLVLRKYVVRSDVSSSVVSTFVDLIGRTDFEMRDDDVEDLGQLAAEFAHSALAAACGARRSRVGCRSDVWAEGWEGLKCEVASMRERQERHERELLSIRQGLVSLREWLSVRSRDVSEVSVLSAKQKGDEREVEVIWSSVLSVE